MAKLYVCSPNPALPLAVSYLIETAEVICVSSFLAPLDAPLIWEGPIEDAPQYTPGLVSLIPPAPPPSTNEKNALVKPISPRILHLKIVQALNALTLQPIQIGNVQFNPKEHALHGDKKTISLTDKESELLLLLCKTPNTPLKRHFILKELWGYTNSIDTNTLETHIYRVRQKLKLADENCTPIETKEDGYVFAFN